jgi:hypothetical protein
MAIFSYMMGDRVSRGAGQSAVKAAAYQARENYTDARTGYAYNHRPREHAGQEPARGIAVASAYIGRGAGYDEGRKPALFVGLYGPKEGPEWCRGRENIEQFWSRAELAERQPQAQIAERIIIALPHELTLKQNIWLLQDHVKEFTRQGRVVQVAIHAPEHGDGRNVHAHLLVSTRGVDEHGFKASKAAEQQERYLHRREYVQGLRARWAAATNRHLERHGHAARVDHRTLAEQGIKREPTIHLGPGDSRRERHGERSVGGEINREVVARNAAREPRAREAYEGHERVRELTGPHARPQRPAHEATETREAERAPATPASANPAPDAPQRGRERQKIGVLERSGRMFRSAFEKALDWVAPRVEDPRLQPPPYRELEKPAPERPLPLYERIALRAQEREREEGRDRDPSFRREDSPLYERYKAEREAAWQARQAAEREVHDRFASYTQDLRGFYQMRFAQEKHSGMPGPVRHDAMDLLAAQRRGDRGHAIRLEREQLAEVRQAHPLPDWGSWLKGEAEKGDRDAARALERHEAREAERNRDRDDDGRGIEP